MEKDRANVIGKIGDGKGPGLVLSGHIDVVLAGDHGFWKVSGPFDPIVEDGYICGRARAYYTEAVTYTKAGIPTVICGRGNIDQVHKPDEYISWGQLDQGVWAFKELI